MATTPQLMNGTILVVDDDTDAAMLLREMLARRGLAVQAVHSAHACLEWLRTHEVDAVVTDVMMAEMSGIELCKILRDQYPEIPGIVVTGQGGLDTAIDAIRAGAYDFIMKPVKVDILAASVSRALENRALKDQLKRLRQQDRGSALAGIVGHSPSIRQTIELVHRVAQSDATVLVTGESGTGKELVARGLHQLSARRDHPFVAINCAAMPAPLLESELFGHVRGAFTDAKRARSGLFVQATGGTLFLDEIGEMPLEMQVKLLRALQDRRIRPVGGDEEIACDARVITATNRDLEVEVREKRFREDLFYRINVVAIPVPPLRERCGDILQLAQYFLRRSAERIGKPVEGISAPAARLLMQYDWPGNVRELENCMERAVALCRFDEVQLDDLPSRVIAASEQKLVMEAAPGELITLDQMERRYVRKVLEATKGNKTHAAKILGIDRRSLYRRLEEPLTPDPSPPPVPPRASEEPENLVE